MSRLGVKTYRYDPITGKHVEIRPKTLKQGAPMYIGDCYSDNPVQSPVDGSVISSRRKLREHNARNGVVDVGNDAAVLRPRPSYEPDSRAIDREIRRAYEIHGAN